ncbi:unnamed protein product [Coregonus sp. 'balchen']|nr:unnamed protein product [Coregonus sp. 'balchen']
MNFSDAKNEIVRLLSRVNSKDLPRLIDWMKNSDEVDDGLVDNQKVILQSISEDLRTCLPLEAVLSSESLAIQKLQFIFQHVLPDLTGRLVVDVGSRLGAVLYGGYLYSSAARLVGVEISAEFVRLQNMAVEKYGFSDRIQVIHADISTQDSLLQNADVLIMNNGGLNLSQWVEELPLDYNVYLGKDGDPDAFKNVHLYRVL